MYCFLHSTLEINKSKAVGKFTLSDLHSVLRRTAACICCSEYASWCIENVYTLAQRIFFGL